MKVVNEEETQTEVEGLEHLTQLELNQEFAMREQLASILKDSVQAERDRRVNKNTLTPEYEAYLQFVIERSAKCHMLNGKYSLAVGCHSQLISHWKQDYDKVNEYMNLWNNDLIDVTIMKDEELLHKLSQVLLCTRRSTDRTRVLMHNANFIDAENAWKQAENFAKLAASIGKTIRNKRPEFAQTSEEAKRLCMMADCLVRVVQCLKFDIDHGKLCHFAVQKAKSSSKSILA